MEIIDNTHYIDKDIEHEMKDSFLNYSMSVIKSRALPDVRDGLKPVHRRILYTMYERNTTASHDYKKCADTVGAVLGSYHPHGDASVYQALARLAQDFSMRYPLIDGQGNFGSVDGDPPAAYRYTESRLMRISDEMIRDIEKDTVDFIPNFDNSKKEPDVLPGRIPNLLVNGSTGIAVGMATNIPPHNMGEVCDGLIYLMDNPDATFADLMEFIPGPDFPTGGIIVGRAGVRSAYATGRGKITLRCHFAPEEVIDGRNRLIIDEIPYMVNKSATVGRIAKLVNDKRLEGIYDLRDESDRKGMRIVIELKRDANPEIVKAHLYKMTKLQDTVGVIMLALDGGVPKVMDLKTMMEKYIDFQRDVVRRATEFDLRKAMDRKEIVRGMIIACDNIDEVIKIIRTSYDDAAGRLIERFSLTARQAEAILNMQLRRLQGLEREKLEAELKELEIKIAEYKEILADKQKILNIIKTDLTNIKNKYGDKRRTRFLDVSGEIDDEDLIPNEECVFTFTEKGYIKRQPKSIYTVQHRGGRGVKGMSRREEDEVTQIFMCKSHNYIIFATDTGRIYRLKGYEIPESDRMSKGSYIGNILTVPEGENITNVIPTRKDDEGYLVMVTKNGVIKRSDLRLYENVRKSGLKAINLDRGDSLAKSVVTSGEDNLIIATKKGMAVRFNENDVRSMGRVTRGVRGIRLEDGDEVIGMDIANDNDNILTVTESGKGRVSPANSYRITARGAKGVLNYPGKKQDNIAGIRRVNEDDDVIIISQNGIIIRLHASDISHQGRTASGVNVMRLDRGDKVVTFAVTLSDEEIESSPREDMPAEDEEELKELIRQSGAEIDEDEE
jgi:DNA gyrase subunit A